MADQPDEQQDPSALKPVQDELAARLGVAPSEVIGASMALAFRVDTGRGERIFLSGVVEDFVPAAVGSVGGRLLVDAGDGVGLSVADELWSPSSGPGPVVGFGPVALSGPPGDSGQRLTVVAGTRPERTRLERAQHLRATLSEAANRLAVEVAADVDWALLSGPGRPCEAWLAAALEHVAATRAAVGAYLVAVADDLDDERIDQLGDGYLRAAELWWAMARGEAGLGPELHELERVCAGWMANAASLPTRYAF